MSKKFVFGNWKMNLGDAAAQDFLKALPEVALRDDVMAAIFPPFTVLNACHQSAPTWLSVGGQNCHWQTKGAFTGEISASMLHQAGAAYVLLGHSERRHGMKETSQQVHDKVLAAWTEGLMPVICVGETLDERQEGLMEAVLETQLTASIPAAEQPAFVIAYEPVWAIGTGVVASTEDIIEAHSFIKKCLHAMLPEGTPMPVLYGGSVTPENVNDITQLACVNGVLVGGASISPASFMELIKNVA